MHQQKKQQTHHHSLITATLKCPEAGYVSAFAKVFLASCLELLQGFQHVV